MSPHSNKSDQEEVNHIYNLIQEKNQERREKEVRIEDIKAEIEEIDKDLLLLYQDFLKAGGATEEQLRKLLPRKKNRGWTKDARSAMAESGQWMTARTLLNLVQKRGHPDVTMNQVSTWLSRAKGQLVEHRSENRKGEKTGQWRWVSKA